MEQKLKDIVNYAYGKCDFYRNLQGNSEFELQTMEEFEKLPIIYKNIFGENTQPIISEDFINKPGIDIIKNHTSGTTGQFINVYWCRADYNASMIELWLQRKQLGIKTSDSLCSFFTTLFVNNSLVRNSSREYMTADKRQLVFSNANLDEQKLVDIYWKMLEYKPKWLLIQPSILQMIVNAKRNNDLPMISSLKYIELIGESFLESFEDEVADEFQCVVKNMYGLIELNSIGYEDKRGELKVLKSNVFVEILKEGKNTQPGEVGEIVVTSLTNRLMPLIRYSTGDYGCWLDDKKDKLLLKKGRSSEYVCLKDSNVPVYVLMAPIQIINSELGNIIRDARFVQKSYENIEVNLHVAKRFKGWEKTIRSEYIKNITDERLKGLHWEVNVFTEYGRHNGGKRKLFELQMEEL